MEEVKNGSPVAFEQLYDRYSKLVFSIGLKMLKNKTDAEDLTHEVFIEIYRNPYSYDSTRGTVEAWIAVKARSRSLDFLRRSKHDKTVYGDELMMDRITDPGLVEEEVLTKAEREELLVAMKSLPETQRNVVYSNYFQGESHRVLAEKLNRPIGTIKSLVRYGINNMKKYFEAQQKSL
nr:sigma-70 family RNA polymerase sigma factor [Bacillus alkalicola]